MEWLERSAIHHRRVREVMGIALLNPSYELTMSLRSLARFSLPSMDAA